MNIARVLPLPLVALAALAFACSSSSSTASAPPQDPGLTGDGDENTAVQAPDANPDGVPYPTAGIGTKPRSGTKAGNRIQNFKFYGYPNGDEAQGLQPVALANYFDPEAKNVQLIHIQASGTWCPHCEKELEAVTPIKAELDKRKVVWLVSIAEGPTPGVPSKKADLDSWMSEFKPPYTHVLDPGNKNLGPFYDAAALPWNANVDARTMEILSAGVGAVETSDGILQELDSTIADMNKKLGDDGSLQ